SLTFLTRVGRSAYMAGTSPLGPPAARLPCCPPPPPVHSLGRTLLVPQPQNQHLSRAAHGALEGVLRLRTLELLREPPSGDEPSGGGRGRGGPAAQGKTSPPRRARPRGHRARRHRGRPARAYAVPTTPLCPARSGT